MVANDIKLHTIDDKNRIMSIITENYNIWNRKKGGYA